MVTSTVTVTLNLALGARAWTGSRRKATPLVLASLTKPPTVTRVDCASAFCRSTAQDSEAGPQPKASPDNDTVKFAAAQGSRVVGPASTAASGGRGKGDGSADPVAVPVEAGTDETGGDEVDATTPAEEVAEDGADAKAVATAEEAGEAKGVVAVATGAEVPVPVGTIGASGELPADGEGKGDGPTLGVLMLTGLGDGLRDGLELQVLVALSVNNAPGPVTDIVGDAVAVAEVRVVPVADPVPVAVDDAVEVAVPKVRVLVWVLVLV